MAGTFTYAGTAAGSAITTTRDKLRLRLGDTNPDAYVHSDEELDYFLDDETDNIDNSALRAAQ